VKIAVLIKQTPDTAELPKVAAEDLSRGSVNTTMVINPWDEFAAEEAILLDERLGAEVVAISLGPADAVDALKHALAMGIPEALMIVQEPGGAADLWTTAATLAAAIRNQGEVKLILTGRQSVDESSGAVYAGVAAQLGYPLLTNVVKIVDLNESELTAERLLDGTLETVRVKLPAVVSVGKEINEPRYPSFMGIRKANKAQIPTITPAELGITPAPRAEWSNIRKPVVERTQVQIIDGATVQDKANKLADLLLAEKVI
jgi:electron transfer flavoprotein beta subunit